MGNFVHCSKRCTSSYPHYLEFPDDWFAVPREGHDARPRPLYLEVSQEWQYFGGVFLVGGHALRVYLGYKMDASGSLWDKFMLRGRVIFVG